MSHARFSCTHGVQRTLLSSTRAAGHARAVPLGVPMSPPRGSVRLGPATHARHGRHQKMNCLASTVVGPSLLPPPPLFPLLRGAVLWRRIMKTGGLPLVMLVPMIIVYMPMRRGCTVSLPVTTMWGQHSRTSGIIDSYRCKLRIERPALNGVSYRW